MKMSNFSFINFSQKLGAQDLRNSVGPLREPTLLNKVLCRVTYTYIAVQKKANWATANTTINTTFYPYKDWGGVGLNCPF